MKKIQEKRYGAMRLYNYFYLCKVYHPYLKDIDCKYVKGNGNRDSYYQITNWVDIREALYILRKISCLKELVGNVFESINPYDREKDVPTISADAKKNFSESLSCLVSSVETIINLCDSIEMGEAKSGIDVKIPKCESLEEYMSYLKEINFVFTQCPYLLCDDEEIKFNTVDVGSQWLSFLIKASAASASTYYILNNLAKLIEKVIAIKSNILLLKQQEEMYESMKQKNEIGEEVIDAFKKMKKLTMDECMNDLEGELGKVDDPEERTKVEKSIEKLVNLIDKGVEIYSSIETPNEVKSLFPFEKETISIPDNILKLIEDKSSQTSDSV